MFLKRMFTEDARRPGVKFAKQSDHWVKASCNPVSVCPGVDATKSAYVRTSMPPLYCVKRRDEKNLLRA